MHRTIISLAVAFALAIAAPAWADNVHIGGNDTTNITATGGAGGAGGQGGNASATGGTHIQTNTQITNQTQGQQQGQAQGQQQGQGQGQQQGQQQKANNDGNHQDVKFESSLIPGVAVAPGLSSVGTYACLGSVSLGLSGPMAGVSFGITKIDHGCEHARDAVILMGWGYPQAALSLLSMNDDTLRALQGDPKAKGFVKAAAPAVAAIPVVSSASAAPAVQTAKSDNAPYCGDGKPAKLRDSGFYSCWGWDR